MKNKSSMPLFALVLTFLVFSTSANASRALTGPTSSTTGNYTISSVSNICGQTLSEYKLTENNRTIQTGCSISKSFSNKSSGTYAYVLMECEYDSEFDREFCVGGAMHTVVVSSDGGTNPNGDNQVRLGQYDNDGLTDIFVDSVASNPYVLRQLSNKSFQLIAGLSSSQITTYSTWPLVTDILVHLSDFNADGTNDLMLANVSSYILGAHDQVVISQYNGNAYSHPQSVSALTAAKQRFLVETLALSQDNNYLLRTMLEKGAYSQTSHGYAVAYFNTAYLQIFQMSYNGSIYVDLNDDPWDDSQPPASCSIYTCQFDAAGGQWQMYVYAQIIETIFDYSIFDPNTVQLANKIDKVRVGTATLDELLAIIAGVVGPVSCNGITSDQVDVFDSVHNYNYFKTNTCTFAVLARYLNGLSIKEIIDDGNKRLQMRARKIREEWWKPFYHAVISDSSKETWFSGLPSDLGTKLIGHKSSFYDRPELTLVVGFINTTLTQEAAIAKIEAATVFYDDDLDYYLAPLPLTSYYNSNGYAKGLINLVGTVTTIGAFGAPGMSDTIDVSINSLRFPGLNKPVPKNEFGF
ncbi:MAG: hypothetical protein ACI8WB_002787 [Phenylobacterium sp.]|jgi:hypothetical protein